MTSQAHATGNLIENNAIGVDATGVAPLDNLTGVTLQSGNNTVSNNVISGNRAFGVSLSMPGSMANTINDNQIGTDASGTVDVGNSIVGVRATLASGNLITGNTISGNDGFGVLLALVGTDNNTVTDNAIGTDESGTAALPNSTDGVRIVQGADDNQVLNNLISGNGARGVAIDGSNTDGNIIDGNFIGLNGALSAALHNGTADAVRLTAPNNLVINNQITAATTGVLVFRAHATGNIIGGNLIGGSPAVGMNEGIRIVGVNDTLIDFNTITDNGTGVQITGNAEGNTITNNSMRNNGIGIDLNADGVTFNDVGDADTGPNRLQNTALIVVADRAGNGDLTVSYVVDSGLANSTYDLTVQFFKSDGNDQGEMLLGSDTYTAAQSGTVDTVTFTPLSGILVGDQIVATVTDADGNTSEFSLDFTVASA